MVSRKICFSLPARRRKALHPEVDLSVKGVGGAFHVLELGWWSDVLSLWWMFVDGGARPVLVLRSGSYWSSWQKHSG